MAAETWSTKMTSYCFFCLQMPPNLRAYIGIQRRESCWPASLSATPCASAGGYNAAGCGADIGQGGLWEIYLSATQAIHTATSMQRTYAQNACMRLKTVRGNQPPATVTENWPVSVSLKHLFLS